MFRTAFLPCVRKCVGNVDMGERAQKLLEGVASLGSVLPIKPICLPRRTSRQALQSDWNTIGKDMWSVVSDRQG
jgi:hypothetical protein